MKTLLLLTTMLLCIFASSEAQNNYFISIDFAGSQCGNPVCPNEPLGLNFEDITTPSTQSYSFEDPLTGSDDIQNIIITLYGDCSTIANFSINNHSIGTETLVSSCECFCGTDDNYISVSAQFSSGIPGYVYGGTNYLNIEHTNLAPFNRIRAFYAEIEINSPSLGVDKHSSLDLRLAIEKNPLKDILRISNLPINTDISLINITGQEVFKTRLLQDVNAIDLSQLASGLYIIKASYLNQIDTQKIIIDN